jgi:DNA-directed RNA polymerase specialized sigma24 family protein
MTEFVEEGNSMTGSGPDDALARAFEQQRGQLVSVAYRMLGSRADAEDAVQEAWQEAWLTGAGRPRKTCLASMNLPGRL